MPGSCLGPYLHSSLLLLPNLKHDVLPLDVRPVYPTSGHEVVMVPLENRSHHLHCQLAHALLSDLPDSTTSLPHPISGCITCQVSFDRYVLQLLRLLHVFDLGYAEKASANRHQLWKCFVVGMDSQELHFDSKFPASLHLGVEWWFPSHPWQHHHHHHSLYA